MCTEICAASLNSIRCVRNTMGFEKLGVKSVEARSTFEVLLLRGKKERKKEERENGFTFSFLIWGGQHLGYHYQSAH